MRHIYILVAALCVTLFARPAAPQERACSVDDVLALMDRVPASELGPGSKKPYRWSRVGQANRIAWSISRTAKTTEQAAELVVYDLREGGNRLDAVGDSGHSYGPWQISDLRARPEVARDPDKAAPIWLDIAARSRTDCASLPEDEQLAEVGSGNCGAGRQLAHRRAALVRQILAEPIVPKDEPILPKE
jgi:hypothetical protein